MGLRARSARRFLSLTVPVGLCVLAIALSFAFVRSGARDDGGPLPGDFGADASGVEAGETGGHDGGDGGREAFKELTKRFAQDDETVREAMNSEASPSSLDAFLDDLSGADDSVGVVEWTDAEGLEHAGGEVLGVYRRAGASLRMHGFLDLRGTSWAAVLQGDKWVDVVSVAGPHEGAASVRVARIEAE